MSTDSMQLGCILENIRGRTDDEKPLPVLYIAMLNVENSIGWQFVNGGRTIVTRMGGPQIDPENAPAIAYIP